MMPCNSDVSVKYDECRTPSEATQESMIGTTDVTPRRDKDEAFREPTEQVLKQASVVASSTSDAVPVSPPKQERLEEIGEALSNRIQV